MLIRTQKLLLRSLNNNNNKSNIFTILFSNSTKSASAFSQNSLNNLAYKAFSQKETRTQNLAKTPVELYTTPIYDIENPEFSEIYLNTLFELNSEELNQVKTNFPKLTENIITLLKLFPSLTNQQAYSAKLDYLLDFLYQNPEKFSFFELTKIFQTLIEKKIGGCNLPIKLNFFIAAKLQQAKAQALKQKNSLEELIHVFFNHFHFCAENGYSNRQILNNFLNILGNEHLHISNLFANEANLNNIIYLISLAVANVNETDKNETTEKAFLEPHKDVITVSNMTVLLKLLRKTAENLELGELSEKTNSRNRLFKALKYLQAEGVQLPQKLEEFLEAYDASEISRSEQATSGTYLPERVAYLLEKIGLDNFERDREFDFSAVDFYIEPGVCLRINHKEDFSNDLLKGRVNLENRYLHLQNYDVVNLPYFAFNNEERLEELFSKRFTNIARGWYKRNNCERIGDSDGI